jgi:DNA-directed RNA polymerase specialized sigma24 family protein
MMTNQEIATVLEISEAAASNRYFRALKRIKTVLQDGEGELT